MKFMTIISQHHVALVLLPLHPNQATSSPLQKLDILFLLQLNLHS